MQLRLRPPLTDDLDLKTLNEFMLQKELAEDSAVHIRVYMAVANLRIY
jgi:hypothetical protein